MRDLSIIPSFIRKNLLGQLFAGLFLILLLSGVTAGFFYIGVEGQLGDQVDTQVRETTNLQSDIYSAWFDSRDSDMGEVVSNLRAQLDEDSDPDELERDLQSETLEASLISHSEFTAFHLVDPDTGEVLASSHESARNESFDPEQFRASEFITPQYESVTGERVMAIGDPLGTRMGEILVGEINATDGGPTVRQTVEGAETAVVTADGDPVLGTASVEASLIAESENTLLEDGDSLVASTQLDNDLFVLTRTPAEEAFLLQDSVLRSFLITLLVTFGVLSIVIGFGGRSVQKSITRLATRAREMEAGDLSIDLSTKREDEVGDLYGSFDAMRVALREQLEESREAWAEAEQFNKQLQVVGRILRHNLRNDLNKVKMYAHRIEVDESESTELDAKRIQVQSDNLLEQADKQRTLIEVLSERREPTEHDISLWAGQTKTKIENEYPHAELTIDISEPPRVRATSRLQIAVEELIDNAIVHSDQETPQVELTLRENEKNVQLLVRDNGPRIPAVEREILDGQEIDPLNHGSGIGLWLVFWIVRQSDGMLRFGANEPRGNTVIVELQRAESDEQTESKTAYRG